MLQSGRARFGSRDQQLSLPVSCTKPLGRIITPRPIAVSEDKRHGDAVNQAWAEPATSAQSESLRCEVDEPTEW